MKEDLITVGQLLERYNITKKTLNVWRKTKGFPDPIPAGRKQWRLDVVNAWETKSQAA